MLLLLISTFWFFLNFMHTKTFERKTLKPMDTCFEYPLVSVILYAQNPNTNLQNLIELLQNQNYPKELYEILIIYDAHNEAHDQWAKNRPHSIVQIHAIKQTFPSSTNRPKIKAYHAAITKARGDWYLFIDENTALHPLLLPSALYRVQADRIGYLCLLPTYQCKHLLEHFTLSYFFAFAHLSFQIQIRKRRLIQNNTLPHFNFGSHLVHKEVYLAVVSHHNLDTMFKEDSLFLNLVRSSPFPMDIKYAETLLQVHMNDSFFNLFNRVVYETNDSLRSLRRALIHSSMILLFTTASFALPLYSFIQGYFQSPFFSAHYATFFIYLLQLIIVFSAHWVYFYTLKTSVFFSFFYPLGYFIHCANLWRVWIKSLFDGSLKRSTPYSH